MYAYDFDLNDVWIKNGWSVNVLRSSHICVMDDGQIIRLWPYGYFGHKDTSKEDSRGRFALAA